MKEQSNLKVSKGEAKTKECKKAEDNKDKERGFLLIDPKGNEANQRAGER